MPLTDNHIARTDKLDAEREIIRDSLSAIADNIGMGLRDAGLHFPVFITMRDSGHSLATIATPLDPSDEDWQRASAIVCQIVGKKVGTDRLKSRELVCAVANMSSIIAADVTAG